MSDFIKAFSPEGWDLGEPPVSQVKVASSGLRGADLQSLVKRASGVFADQIRNMDFKPGDIPVHLIAMGSTESIGCNRNGDGFPHAALAKYHQTFAKHAKPFRHHKNKPHHPHYGAVKAAHYNDPMQRVELLVVYNGTKEAAARNGGYVADKEMELLEKFGQFSVSMSVRVPFDICSSCGNKAKNRLEYCTGEDEGGHCKAGGLRNRIACYCGEPHSPVLHAINPEGLDFFDISLVGRGADRAAHALGIYKTASGEVKGGAAVAEAFGITAPAYLAAESAAEPYFELAGYLANAVKASDDWLLAAEAAEPLPLPPAQATLEQTFAKLAQHGCVLPIREFVRLLANATNADFEKLAAVAAAASEYTAATLADLADSPALPALVSQTAALYSASPPRSSRMDSWAKQASQQYGVGREAVRARLNRGLVLYGKPASIKMAGSVEAADKAVAELSRQYSAYLLHAAANIAAAASDPGFSLHQLSRIATV